MNGILPQSMGEYLAAGATEWIPKARFDDIEAGDLVCQVHNGAVLQASVAQTLTVGHDGKTRVWRAADGGTVAWEDEPSNSDSHLVICRTVGVKATVATVASEGPGPFKEGAAFEDVQVGDRVRMTLAGVDHIESVEGVIATLASIGEQWHRAESGRGIVCRSVFKGETRTIAILDRPTPQLPSGDGEMILSGNVFYLWDGPLGWKSLAGDGHVSYEDMARRDWKPAKVVLA